MRGYFGIGIDNVKFSANISGLFRSAYAMHANFIFVIGNRYRHTKQDTSHAEYNIPLYNYETFGHFRESVPEHCKVVGIEYPAPAFSGKKSWELPKFSHPEQAIYLLGAEDTGISSDGLILCDSFIHIPSQYCLNVATAGSVVMYDRFAKQAK